MALREGYSTESIHTVEGTYFQYRHKDGGIGLILKANELQVVSKQKTNIQSKLKSFELYFSRKGAYSS